MRRYRWAYTCAEKMCVWATAVAAQTWARQPRIRRIRLHSVATLQNLLAPEASAVGWWSSKLKAFFLWACGRPHMSQTAKDGLWPVTLEVWIVATLQNYYQAQTAPGYNALIYFVNDQKHISLKKMFSWKLFDDYSFSSGWLKMTTWWLILIFTYTSGHITRLVGTMYLCCFPIEN